jgi:hypothetical protein
VGPEVVFALVAEMSLELEPTNQAVAWRIDGVREEGVSRSQNVLPLAEPITLGEQLLTGLLKRSGAGRLKAFIRPALLVRDASARTPPLLVRGR